MDNITVANLILREQIEETVERRIVLAQNRPGVARVLETNVRLENIETEVVDGGVRINGILRTTILYVPEDNTAAVETIEKRISFSFVVDVNVPGRTVEIDPALFVQEAEVIIVDPHNLRLTVVIVGRLNFIEAENINFITDDQAQIVRDEFEFDQVVAEKTVTRQVERVVELANNQAPIERVLNIQSTTRIINTHVRRNQVEVQAEIRSQILYQSPDGRTRSLNITTPFTERIRIEGARSGMQAFVDLEIIDQDFRIIDPRTLRINYETEINTAVLTRDQIDFPIDIDGDLFPRRRTVLVERIVARKQTRVLLRDTIDVPPPGASRVVRVTADVADQVIEADVDDGGVFISGEVDVNVLYVANQPDQPVFFVGDTLFFDEFISVSIPRDVFRVRAYPEVRVVSAEGEVVDGDTIRIRVLLSIEVLVTAIVEVPVVIGVGEDREEFEPPRPTPDEGEIYIVKQGDTLFIIAQRFGVTIAELVAVNDIVNPDQLEVGQELIIPD